MSHPPWARRTARRQPYGRRPRPAPAAAARIAHLGTARTAAARQDPADSGLAPAATRGWVPSVDLDAMLEDLRLRSRPGTALRHDAEGAPGPGPAESRHRGAEPPEPAEPAGPAGPTGPSARPLPRWGGSRRAVARADPGRRGAGAIAIAAGLAAMATALWVLLGTPSGGVTQLDQVAVTAADPTGARGSSLGTGSPTVAAQVVVDVAGLVASPGVYTLPNGARVADALAAAGGALPGVDLSLLNLARLLVDGEQIPVGVVGDPGTVGPPGAGTAALGAPVDLNRATAEVLDQLPGVGPVLAQSILDWRQEHGRFDAVDQLREVPGIGDAKYAQLKDRVRV